MKTKRLMGALLGLFCLTFCACTSFGIEPMGPPRVTTPDERAEALALLDDAELCLDAAALAGLEAQDVEKGRAAIGELRKLVNESETVPVSWRTVLRAALRLSLQWATDG